MQRGRELRAELQKVAKLYSHDKTGQAKEAFQAIPDCKTTGPRAVLGRADELRELLFTFGGLKTTRAVLDKFLCLPEVSWLLDDSFLKTRLVTSRYRSQVVPEMPADFRFEESI